jgi:hypothetical protein
MKTKKINEQIAEPSRSDAQGSSHVNARAQRLPEMDSEVKARLPDWACWLLTQYEMLSNQRAKTSSSPRGLGGEQREGCVRGGYVAKGVKRCESH